MKNRQEIFLKAFNPIKQNIWRFCLHLCRNSEDAKDLLQDVIETTYINFDGIKDKSTLMSYMFSVASRKNLNKIRKKKELLTEDFEQYHEIADYSVNIEKWADINILYQMMEKLPPDYKETLILCEIMDIPHSEAAQIQNITIDGIRQRLYRAKQKLKNIFETDISERNKTLISRSI